MVRVKSNLVLFSLAVFLLVIYFFVFGESGVLERIELHKNKTGLISRINALQDENRELRSEYGRYRNGEFLQEEAYKAGYVEQGDKILHIIKPERESTGTGADAEKKRRYFSEIDHLRIIWAVVSVLVLFFYFAWKSKHKED